MRARRLLLCLLGLVVVLGVTAGAAFALLVGTAIEVPGTGALNTGGIAGTASVSCASAGECSAGGGYTDSSGHGQAFVVNESGGVWGTAMKVPGTAGLNTGSAAFALVSSVSCASPGNCSAGGFYRGSSNHQQAFVVDASGGVWANAIEVPTTAILNAGGYAALNSVSCASPGNCSAGGYYTDGSNREQAFVVDETNRIWGTAIKVPGTGSLNTGSNGTVGKIAGVNSVSCASVGNCSAGGFYTGSSGKVQAFVAKETNGVWGTAILVPGMGSLNHYIAKVDSVSCASAGNCSAGGAYIDSSGYRQAFVVTETTGTWGTAIKVPNTGALNTDGWAEVLSVSCAGAGKCSAGGYYSTYANNAPRQHAFVVQENNGVWGTAIQAPGTAGLNTGGFAAVNSVSCYAIGHCVAGGYYTDSSNHNQAFALRANNGVWGTAIEVPGTAGLNTGGYAEVSSVSCVSGGQCAAGGGYSTNPGHKGQAFVTHP